MSKLLDQKLTNGFHNDQNKKIQIDFMSQKENFNYFSGKIFDMVDLPYVGDRYCLGIILPNKQVSISDLDLN